MPLSVWGGDWFSHCRSRQVQKRRLAQLGHWQQFKLRLTWCAWMTREKNMTCATCKVLQGTVVPYSGEWSHLLTIVCLIVAGVCPWRYLRHQWNIDPRNDERDRIVSHYGCARDLDQSEKTDNAIFIHFPILTRLLEFHVLWLIWFCFFDRE